MATATGMPVKPRPTSWAGSAQLADTETPVALSGLKTAEDSITEQQHQPRDAPVGRALGLAVEEEGDEAARQRPRRGSPCGQEVQAASVADNVL